MADRSRGKPPRPVIAPDEEMTVFAQQAPKAAPQKAAPQKAAPQKRPDPATQQPEEEGTMMMVPQAGPQTGPPPPGLASTMLVSPQSQYAQSGSNPALRNPLQNPPAQSAYGPPLDGRAWMQQQQQQGQQGQPQRQAPQTGPQPQMGMQAPQTGPQMQVQSNPAPLSNYRALPPPAAPPGIVLRGKIDPRLVLVSEPESARATGFRMLRDNLLAKRLPRVLAISSAMKGDGKTTCAVNLGLSLSEGARVLVLDGNLIEPSLHKMFGIDESTVPSAVNGPWTSPYTIAEYSPTYHIAALAKAAGVRFERRWFEQLMISLRRTHYDFIIIDTASLNAAPTVSQIVATADATLLAVKAGVTTARALRRASEQIPDGRGIGVALVDTKPTG